MAGSCITWIGLHVLQVGSPPAHGEPPSTVDQTEVKGGHTNTVHKQAPGRSFQSRNTSISTSEVNVTSKAAAKESPHIQSLAQEERLQANDVYYYCDSAANSPIDHGAAAAPIMIICHPENYTDRTGSLTPIVNSCRAI